MIIPRPFQHAMRGVGRNALDLPVAGLAALAAIFFAFAVPSDILGQIVGATGLPSILSAAEPPLGLTARIALGAGGALITFGLVFFLLRLLDRSGLDSERQPPEPAAAAATEDEPPRLRRRDFHPDAPVRRPISAARDLGEPAPPELPRAATPLWLDEAEPEAVEPEAPAPEPETPPEPIAAAEMPSSIGELMARLENGLARRRAGSGAPAFPPPQPQVFPEASDDRLQSAIDSLQRLAARQS